MSKLAIFGGQPTVSVPYDKTWPPISEEEIAACVRLLYRREISYYGREGEVKKLEDKFCEYHGVKYAIATNTGTSALHSAFFALGIGPGDEVIAPTYTFLATVTPILQCYASPVLCDCESDTGNIDPDQVRAAISERTKAVVITHMWGHPCDMDRLKAICDKYGLYLVEDCSHAHGATYNGQKVGTFGDVACFSLQSQKIITGGTGGILITNDQEIYERATLLGHFRVRSEQCVRSARYAKYADTGFGMNYRMHPVAAAIAHIQMSELDKRIALRTESLNYLSELLSQVPGIRPPVTRQNVTRGAYYGYKPHYEGEYLWGLPIDTYVEALQAEGVAVHLPGSKPLHLSALFQGGTEDLYSFREQLPRFPFPQLSCSPGDFPVSEKFYYTSLSLPTFTGAPKILLEQYAEAFDKVARYAEQIRDWKEGIRSAE